jgi:hypothetical protein
MVPPGLEEMTDDDQRRTRALGALAAFRFAPSCFSQPIVLRHRLERTQEIPPLGGDLPAVAIAKHVAAGENIDGLNPSGKTPIRALHSGPLVARMAMSLLSEAVVALPLS